MAAVYWVHEKVYPRPHGEAASNGRTWDAASGLSPPTRGSLLRNAVPYFRLRSIPAHTGKPPAECRTIFPAAVYPRPHGEARPVPLRHQDAQGLSPPTRGSRRGGDGRRCRRRSIPAHTGKPPGARRTTGIISVYPRPHGEADGEAVEDPAERGLSPPTRGSRNSGSWCPPEVGSIPAHTGKPASRSSRRRPTPVYPRPHGEAKDATEHARRMYGLSPPTRGSPHRRDYAHQRSGSIPAHTGKPGSARTRADPPTVYPRPHGEASDSASPPAKVEGLSPPTRGSHPAPLWPCGGKRSIPAHTGKPPSRNGTPRWPGVYPRPHGEASPTIMRMYRGPGLSPPTRGSRVPGRGAPAGRRSIPAHTGKPPGGSVSSSSCWVYPRPHGEAAEAPPPIPSSSGLSPPTRGSPPRTPEDTP